jgi:hypothetical protein
VLDWTKPLRTIPLGTSAKYIGRDRQGYHIVQLDGSSELLRYHHSGLPNYPNADRLENTPGYGTRWISLCFDTKDNFAAQFTSYPAALEFCTREGVKGRWSAPIAVTVPEWLP